MHSLCSVIRKDILGQFAISFHCFLSLQIKPGGLSEGDKLASCCLCSFPAAVKASLKVYVYPVSVSTSGRAPGKRPPVSLPSFPGRRLRKHCGAADDMVPDVPGIALRSMLTCSGHRASAEEMQGCIAQVDSAGQAGPPAHSWLYFLGQE